MINTSDAGYHNMLLTRQVLSYVRQLHNTVRAESVRSPQRDDRQGIKL